LLKSGAGTAFYDCIYPQHRESLKKDFLRILGERHEGTIEVIHDYVSCVAGKAD
jgi:hypothetical protein